jgi:NodT family efflux transporter outer membrane factor (OMF) lipoprotein
MAMPASHFMKTLPSPTPPRRRTPTHTRLVALALPLALWLAGCSTPMLHSTVDVPTRYVAADASQPSEPEAAWWESYGDPVLTGLIRRAASENRDVRIAAQRVLAARAGETVSRSALFPAIGVSAGASNQTSGYDEATRQILFDQKRANAGLDVSWEVDLSGRLRAGARAAAADTIATEDGERGVRLLVMTDVAANYFTLVGAQRQLETVSAIVAAQDETLRLVSARQRAGLATAFDVERAQTDASRSHAAIPPLETLVAVSRHRIAVLIGDQAGNAASIVPSMADIDAPTARPGQPAELLERRPDLLALRAQVDAANARRQQAHAEWFPRLFLGALFGSENIQLNGTSIGSARYTSVAGLLAMPLFNAGRTRAINEISEANQKEAVLRYEDGIVRALEDVENSLVTLNQERQRSQDLQTAARSAEAALGRAQSLYDRGQIDLLPLLDAQRARLSVRMSANDSRTQLLLDSVQLYKSLGGGWQAFEPQPASTESNPTPKS